MVSSNLVWPGTVQLGCSSVLFPLVSISSIVCVSDGHFHVQIRCEDIVPRVFRSGEATGASKSSEVNHQNYLPLFSSPPLSPTNSRVKTREKVV
jgi:hypothetical protein